MEQKKAGNEFLYWSQFPVKSILVFSSLHCFKTKVCSIFWNPHINKLYFVWLLWEKTGSAQEW